MIGQKFGLLTVLERAGSDRQRCALWKCQCDCGEYTVVRGANLRNGHTQSCGKHNRGNRTGHPNQLKGQENLAIYTNAWPTMIGQKYGKLLVLERAGNHIYPSGQTQPRLRCKCDCGNEVIVAPQSLRNGATQSCGCITTSIGESNIQQILLENNIEFIKGYKFSDLGSLRYDFYLPNYNRLIEFDGRQHNNPSSLWDDKESFETRKHRDQLKNDYAKNHSIDLVRIPYIERDSITLELLLGDKYLLK